MQYDIKNKIIDEQRVLYEIFHPGILLIGFFIGLFHTTNFWDFPIYFVVSGAVILFSNAVVYGFKNKALLMTAAHGVVITVIAELMALPFTLNFEQISTELNIATSHTPMYQLVILWGLPCALIIGLMIQLITIFKQRQRELTQLNTKETGSKHSNVIVKFMTDLHVSDLFIVTIGLCAIGLVLIPEVIYVKDIYSGDYKRANTMFKLTYQAFIMFGICTGFIIVKFLKFNQLHWQRKFTVITLLCLLSSMWYSKVAISAWYINADQTKNYIGLDAAAFMETTMPDDYLATNWLNENIKGTPIIVEANGDSYTDYQRVSVVTGLPTILGWYTHEWLWRGNNEVVDARAADILTIYTSTDKDQVLSLIKEYNIEYIYVGKLEQDKYTTVNHTLLKEVGKVVFTIPVTQDKTYETYIVHVIE